MLTRTSAAALAAAALLVSACSSDATGSDGASGGNRMQVTAAFYPLQYVAERIGGDAVEVTSLTPPGGEPHDLELTPQDLATLQESDLVVHLSGFQPAVDEAIAQTPDVVTVDAADSADLEHPDSGHSEEQHGEAGHTDDEHTEDEHGGLDPHFWLDTSRLSEVAAAVEEAMAQADPDQADALAANLAALQRDLKGLDEEYATGLADCTVTSLVTGHESFGYLAQRYGMAQVGIAGLSPDAEPDPQQVAAVADLVEREDVRTIYTETLVSPAVAQTVADETGAQTAVLDPLEGLTDESAGSDYVSVMRANLETLREGQDCR
ncbi:MAG TPA: zinc ABC transporter substrate-binding protein [Nocardioidaceae bacterium]|nr:zinc ABC transporter substrate-binding protein [Nocardioidaceae bacterium]